MKVNLTRYTPDAQKLVTSGVKLCYSDSSVMEIEEELTGRNVENFIDKSMGLGHMSPVEHISFTFAIEGVSRISIHQLARYRLANYSRKSQRYVKASNYEYIIPPKIKNNPRALEIYEKHMKHTIGAYNELTEILIQEKYGRLVESGVDKKKAESMSEKGSIEDARHVFSNATEAKTAMTVSTHELLHFFEVRCCQRAQWEMKGTTTLMLIETKKMYPQIFKRAEPGCVKESCPEGKVTCDKIRQVREYFSSLD